MSLMIYNTLTGQKEPFEPLVPGHVRMYVCGVTVYDLCHIGHARSAVVFDVIYRYLKYSCFEVDYVRNFTDVDDKIIRRANEQGVSSAEIAGRYIEAFRQDMDALGVERPTREPLATEHIQEMIEHVERLEQAGHAYTVDGDVYFSVQSYPAYGRLSRRPLDEMESGARVEVDERKKSPLDFALWKSSKPGEPSWDSPWGPGRPGWHIECTVMGQKYLGATFDIHGGGKDLVFPHHENEVAQAEADSGQPFANYWVHNGFVNIDKEKMSKSLGNFFTIRDVLATVHPEVLRLFLLSHHYRSPVDYTEDSLRDAAASLDRLYGTLERLEQALADQTVPNQVPVAQLGNGERTVHEAVLGLFNDFDRAMNDDFNTAEALGHLHRAARQVGAYLHAGFQTDERSLAVLGYARESLRKLGGVLGILQEDPATYFQGKQREVLQQAGLDNATIDAKIAERTAARAAKDWAKADQVRDELAELGIELKDGPEGTTWTVKR